MNNTNASATQAGFHYQDIVGLILFIDNVANVQSINVEGDDDIDILFTDGTYGFYQVKEVQNPDNNNMAKKLTEALKTLEADANKQNLKSLTYVSNANHPLGNLKNSLEFFKPYAYYKYNDLSKNLKAKIDNKLAIHPRIDKNKLGVMKIAYEGSDSLTRESELDARIHKFIGSTGLSEAHFNNLKNEWRQMIIKTTEFSQTHITKEQFYSHTVVTAMFQNPNLDNFFNECQILPTNEIYIQNNYIHHLNRLMEKFQLVNSIETNFILFRNENRNLGRLDLMMNFINIYYPQLKKDLGLVDKEDDDIAKFILWISIRTHAVTRNIKGFMKL